MGWIGLARAVILALVALIGQHESADFGLVAAGGQLAGAAQVAASSGSKSADGREGQRRRKRARLAEKVEKGGSNLLMLRQTSRKLKLAAPQSSSSRFQNSGLLTTSIRAAGFVAKNGGRIVGIMIIVGE